MEEKKKGKDILDFGELEYLILSYARKDRAFWLKIIDFMKISYFEFEDNAKIFEAWKDYFKKYNKIPKREIIKIEVKSIKESDIEKIYCDPPEDSKKYMYDKMFEFMQYNVMMSALKNSVDFLEKRKFSEIYSEIRKASLFTMDTSLGVSIFDVDKRYERINAMEQDRITTGFPQLNRILGGSIDSGGWANKGIYCVAAPPGFGKSIFLANFAANALKMAQKNILVYTLEISEESLSMRHDAILSDIHTDELMHNTDKLKEKLGILRKISKSDMIIKEFPTRAVTVNSLRSHMEQLKLYLNFIPNIIIIDYAGLLVPTYRTGESYSDLKTIFEDLSGLADEMNIPVVTAAQTNRKSLDEKGGGTKETITQAQVAESLGITQTLDVFMTITQSVPEKNEGSINLYVDKNRHGASGKNINFKIEYKTFKLEEVESNE
jgi:replicative DNA helicase